MNDSALPGDSMTASNSKGQKLFPEQLIKALGDSLDRPPLEALEGVSIVNPRQFDRRTIVAIAQLAAMLESRNIEMEKPLDGKIAITAFFERQYTDPPII